MLRVIIHSSTHLRFFCLYLICFCSHFILNKFIWLLCSFTRIKLFSVFSQSFTLEDLYNDQNKKHYKLERQDSSGHMTSYDGSVVEEDRRLPMFCYTVETINLLLLPMIQNRWATVILAFLEAFIELSVLVTHALEKAFYCFFYLSEALLLWTELTLSIS